MARQDLHLPAEWCSGLADLASILATWAEIHIEECSGSVVWL